MAKFRVVWEIDIEADAAVDAAFDAWRIMQRCGSTACVFTVTDKDTGKESTVDLLVDVVGTKESE